MSITSNHTIVPAFDRETSARFYCDLFGFEYIGEFTRLDVVHVNETLWLDFANEKHFEPHHYIFKETDPIFDEIFERIRHNQIKYGSGHYESENMTINYNYGESGTYFRNMNKHLLEIMTTDYELQ